MIESLLGGVFGGVLRLTPEIMKLWDRANERRHELAMTELDLKRMDKEHEMKLALGEQGLSRAELDAVAVVNREQGETARGAYRWVAAVSALIRPGVTIWLFVLYAVIKLAAMYTAHLAGVAPLQVLTSAWGADDVAMLNMCISFWFVGRIYERHRNSA